jgi:predicted MFS family arabinose efflux permease
MSTPPAAAEPPAKALAGGWRPYQYYALFLLVLVSVSNYLDRNIVALLQEPIKADLKLSDWQLGLISGPAFALFYSFAGLPVARIAERANRPALLAVCITVWSTMTALCGMAGNFVQMVLLRAGVGIGEGGCNPIAHSIVAETFTVRQRGSAMAVLSAAAPIGGIVAPLLGGFAAHLWGWRVAFLVVGLPGLILALLVLLTLKEPRKTRGTAVHTQSFATDFRWLISNPAFVLVFVAGAFNGIGIQGIGIFTTSFMIREHGLDLAAAGTVVSMFGVMGLLGTFVGGYLADRFADSRGRSYVLVPALGAGLSFLFFIFAYQQSYWPLALALLLLGNVATDLKNGPNFAAVQNIVPSRMRATAAAMFFLAATVVGTTIGAAAVGGLSDLAAARAFGTDVATFNAACPGGRAVAGATAEAASACLSAAAGGLKTSLTVLPFVFLVAMTCFYLASRFIRVNTD